MKRKAFDLLPAIKRLELSTKSSILNEVLGSYRSVFRGHGLEFDGYRAYSSGDDAQRIDWKASVRSDDVLVKEFVEERNLTVFLLIDVSDSMLVGSSKAPLKMQYAAELGAFLCQAVVQSDDTIGWALFAHEVKTFSRPQTHPSQFYRYAQDVVDPKWYGGSMNLQHAFEETMRFLAPGSIVIVISDFIGIESKWEKAVRMFGAKYDVIALIVHDVYDHTLPDEDVYLVLEHPSSGTQTTIHAIESRYQFEHLAAQYDKAIRDKLTHAGIDHLHLTTNQSFVSPLIAFFKQRLRRRR